MHIATSIVGVKLQPLHASFDWRHVAVISLHLRHVTVNSFDWLHVTVSSFDWRHVTVHLIGVM